MLWLLVLALVLLIIIWAIAAYNKFVRYQENISNAMS